MEQYVTKKDDRPKGGRKSRGLLYWLFWLVLSFRALAYTLPFLLLGGLCGLMLFARNRMDGAFAWRNRVVRRFDGGGDDEGDTVVIDGKSDN